MLTVFTGLTSHSDLGVAKLQREKEITFVRPEQVRILQKVRIEKLHTALEKCIAKLHTDKTRRAYAASVNSTKTGVQENNF